MSDIISHAIDPQKDTAKYLAEKIKHNDSQSAVNETASTAAAADSALAMSSVQSNNFENVPAEYNKDDNNSLRSEKDDSIKEDVLVRDTVLYPQVVLNEDYTTIVENQAPKSAPMNIQSNAGKAVMGHNLSQDKKTATAKPANYTNGIRVEFWKSPVHYKGYKYFRNILTLYDVNKGDDIKLYTYLGELYMGKGGNYYKFTNEDAFNSFKTVKDKDILKHFGQ